MKEDRITTWFVQGQRADGSRWESGLRHPTKAEAEEEIRQWALRGANCGVMKLMRETTLPRKPR